MSTTFSPALRGIAFVVCAVACFAALDTTVKIVGATVPIVMGVWFRYIFQALVTGAWMWRQKGPAVFRMRRPGLHVLRGLLLLTATVLAYASLQFMPLGEFTAILMLTPLVITASAGLLLGERVSFVRWALVAMGFLGALVIIRPGIVPVGWPMLMPLGMVVAVAGFQLLTSRMARLDDPGAMHFYTGFVGAAVTTLLLPFFWATPVDGWIWLGLLGLGVFGSLGHFLLILGYARAPAATLTPFLYLQIAFATLAGWQVFAHLPDAWSWTGLALIATAGIAGTWLTARETRAAGMPVAG